VLEKIQYSDDEITSSLWLFLKGVENAALMPSVLELVSPEYRARRVSFWTRQILHILPEEVAAIYYGYINNGKRIVRFDEAVVVDVDRIKTPGDAQCVSYNGYSIPQEQVWTLAQVNDHLQKLSQTAPRIFHHEFVSEVVG